MLELRPGQLAELEARIWEQVRCRIAEAVRRHPETRVSTWAPQRVSTCVDDAVLRARRFGLVTEEGITAFVVSSFSISPDFHRVPRARDVLAEMAFPELERVRRARDAAHAALDSFQGGTATRPPWAEEALAETADEDP